MRDLFVTVLIFCDVAEPLKLWEKFSSDLCDDFLHKHAGTCNAVTNAVNQALSYISEGLQRCGNKLLTDYELPTPSRTKNDMNIALTSELNYDRLQLKAQAEMHIKKFNTLQASVFQAVTASIESDKGSLFFWTLQVEQERHLCCKRFWTILEPKDMFHLHVHHLELPLLC